jgi:hypothetical protein
MGKSTRGTSWKSHRLADRLEIDGTEYTVDLIARRATGVQGYRVSVVFLPRDGGAEVQAALPNAASNVDVNHQVRELAPNADRLRSLFRAARAP